MNELTKIKDVMKKVVPNAPHEVLLVLDGSTGQNAFEQAKQFTLATEVTALAITKLDGTAKGGVVIGISDQFQIPVKYIGLGEGIDHLQLFNRRRYVDSFSVQIDTMAAQKPSPCSHWDARNLVDSESSLSFSVRGYTILRPGPPKELGCHQHLRIHRCQENPSIPFLNMPGFVERAHCWAVCNGCFHMLFIELQGEIPGRWLLANSILRCYRPGETAAPNGCIERHLTTPPHYAYLKISKLQPDLFYYKSIITASSSRPMDEVVQEARMLVSKGVQEIQLIAQDLSYYGKDRYKSLKLPELVSRLSDIPDLKWLRLHYTYPYDFPMELLPVIRERDNVCNYLDMALQHISDPMLLQMRRKINKADTLELLARIREEVPGIHLRTTLLVGHPGETEADFQQLLDCVGKTRFERMGAFVYSEEEGTYAARHYKDDIPDSVKQARLEELMLLQQGISESINRQKIGQELAVVIDRVEGDLLIGRTEFDSPEVDPEIHLAAVPGVSPGTFGCAVVTDAGPYDLYGKWISLT